MISAKLSDALPGTESTSKQRLDYYQGQLEAIPHTFYALFWLYSHDLLYVSKSIENVLGHPAEKFMDHGMVFFQNIIPARFISHIYKSIYSHTLQIEIHPDYICSKEFLKLEAAVFNSKMEEVLLACNAMVLDVKPFFPTSYLVACSWMDLRNMDRREKMERAKIITSLLLNIKEQYIESHSEHFNTLMCRNKISKREKEVALLLMDGLNTRRISDKLRITFNTVESHRKNLLEKFEAKNTPELIHKFNNISF